MIYISERFALISSGAESAQPASVLILKKKWHYNDGKKKMPFRAKKLYTENWQSTDIAFAATMKFKTSVKPLIV